MVGFGFWFGLVWFGSLVTCIFFHTERFTKHKLLCPLYVLSGYKNITFFIFFLRIGAIMAIHDMFSFIIVLFNDILIYQVDILSLLENL